MKQYRVAFLVNPISGGGRGGELYKLLPEVMGSFGYETQEWCAEFTQMEESARQIARLSDQSERLIAVGGDGTMNAVLSELVRHPDGGGAVGLVPLGTGNDLARVLGIYRNYSDKGLPNTLRKLVMAQSDLFDVWALPGGRMMAAYCSAGLDARIAEEWDRERSGGKIPFGSEWIKKAWYLPVFWRNRSHRLPEGSRLRWITPGGAIHQADLSRRRSIVIGNIRSYAGGARPFGNSHYADGQLEILLLPSIFKFAMATFFSRHSLLARWLSRSILRVEAASEVDLFVPKGEAVQVDGEVRTNDLSGEWIRIRHAGQLRLLALRG